MKKRLYLYMLLLVIASLQAGCSLMIEYFFPPTPPPGPETKWTYYILEFKSWEYKDYILTSVTDSARLDKRFLSRPRIKPYVELSNDKVMVSFGYAGIYPAANAGIITTRWSEFDGTKVSWPLDSILHSSPIQHVYAIGPDEVKTYDLRAEEYFRRLSFYEDVENTRDSLNIICQRTLSRMIREGTFFRACGKD